MQLSPKQAAFWVGATHRWNIKTGATRSGKTFLDYYLIPRRIRACTGSGLIVLLGNTQGTLQRNIIDPMREIYGPRLVKNISSDNTVRLFGRKCYALGADKANQVTKIQGAGIEYCYGDEVTTWHHSVFDMLKSRLDKPNSCFDGTCNPDNPNHWFKAFLESDADIFGQAYQIDDNPFLTPAFVDNLKREYAGTVLYDRFILGQWAVAEGLIFRQFADNPKKWIRRQKPTAADGLRQIFIGVDFGGNGSKTTFVATGVLGSFERLCVVDDHKIPGGKGTIDPETVEREFVAFVRRVQAAYPGTPTPYAFCDNESQYLINGLRKACAREALQIGVTDCFKAAITDRIYCLAGLINTGRFEVMEHCENVINSLKTQVWKENQTEDIRLDDGTYDIDTADALEYTFSRFLRALGWKG